MATGARASGVMPNPSLKRSANGKPPARTWGPAFVARLDRKLSLIHRTTYPNTLDLEVLFSCGCLLVLVRVCLPVARPAQERSALCNKSSSGCGSGGCL